MHIIFFSFGNIFCEGGFEKYIIEISNSLVNNGHKVTILHKSFLGKIINPPFFWKIAILLSEGKLVNTTPKMVQRELNKQIHLIDLSFVNFLFKFWKIRKFLKSSDSDVVYCKNEVLDIGCFYLLFGKKIFKKVVIGTHTAIFLEKADTFHSKIHNFFYFSRIYKKILETCGAIHTLNNSDGDKISTEYGIPKSKMYCIPIGINDKEFSLNVTVNTDHKFRFLFAGRLTEQKGVDYLEVLIDSLSRGHLVDFKGMEFVIAGNGYQDYIAKRLSGKFDNVKFLGFVEDKNRLYKDIDITIILSRYETVSYIALESQCRGIPVIAFDIPGPQDIVLSGQTGILVPPGDIQQFKNDVIKFYTLKTKKREEFFDMKQATFEKARERFGMNNVINKIELMFQNHSQAI